MRGTSGTEFGGKVALVTAAAGMGIGQATARRLAAGGARVVVTDSHERRTNAVAAAIAAEYPDTSVVGHVLDVGDLANIDVVVAEVTRSLGPIQLLVNNAAWNWPGPIWDYPIDQWQRTLAVNLTGPWYLCRQTMPAMRAAGGGSIVNVGSEAADDGGRFGGEPVYAITKGALETMTRGVAVDGGPHNIRVNTLSMGCISGTKFMVDHPDQEERAAKGTPLGRLPTTQEVAETIAFLLSDRAASITGDLVTINGGYKMRT